MYCVCTSSTSWKKFESRAKEGVLLETLEYGVYRVLIRSEDKAPEITDSRHVTFIERQFLGAEDLSHIMSDEDSSDNDF
eukprot:IDg8424t1